MVWPFKNKTEANDEHNFESNGKLLQKHNTKDSVEEAFAMPGSSRQEEEEDEGYQSKYKYAPKRRDEEEAMDLGTLQDVFSFSFMRGRPIFNFFLAIIWSIGLPILLYNILKPHIGQVLAMIVASAPPLTIVVV